MYLDSRPRAIFLKIPRSIKFVAAGKCANGSKTTRG